jgi:hypothetical protein
VQQTSTAYMQQVNTQFMQAGAKGISILFASHHIMHYKKCALPLTI